MHTRQPKTRTGVLDAKEEMRSVHGVPPIPKPGERDRDALLQPVALRLNRPAQVVAPQGRQVLIPAFAGERRRGFRELRLRRSF